MITFAKDSSFLMNARICLTATFLPCLVDHAEQTSHEPPNPDACTCLLTTCPSRLRCDSSDNNFTRSSIFWITARMPRGGGTLRQPRGDTVREMLGMQSRAHVNIPKKSHLSVHTTRAYVLTESKYHLQRKHPSSVHATVSWCRISHAPWK